MTDVADAATVFTPTARWLATAAALSAYFISIFTGTMVNVAIPDVMGAFGVGQTQAQFLSSTFLAMNTTGLLASAWLIGKLGQRATFFLALIVFAGAAVLCFIAPTIEALIVGRVLQGVAAGVIQPLVMMVLFQVFPMERRGLAMAMFSMGVTVALGLGPSVGGMAIDAFSWRTIFLVPIPACGLAILLGFIFLPPENHRGKPGKFDLLGFALINVTVLSWFTLLGNGQRWGWVSDDIMALGVLTVGAGVTFVYSQKRPGASLLDLSLFGNSRFVTTLYASALFGFANFASVYAFPIFGQIVQNFSPTVAGSMLLPGSLFAAAMLPLAGRLSDKLPPPLVICVGNIVICGSVLMLAGADSNTMFWYVALALLIGRVGSALVAPGVNATAISALSPAQVRTGAGVVNLALMLGGSTGISTYVILLEQRIEFHAVQLGATQTSANSATWELLSAVSARLSATGLPDAVQQGVAMSYLNRVVAAQADVLGFQDGFVAIALATLVPLIPVLLLVRQKR